MTYEPTALIVVSHHRSDSLTAAVAERAATRLKLAGYRIDTLDLAAEGFDPRNGEADEPDYGNRDKRYSDEVHAHIRRVHAADAIVVVFPIWWFGLPAQLKGWIDRVWNYGLAYGRRDSPMPDKRMLWLGLAGNPADDPNTDLIHHLLDGTLRRGISEYCGVHNTHTAALFDSEAHGLTGEARDRHYRALFTDADTAADKLIAG